MYDARSDPPLTADNYPRLIATTVRPNVPCNLCDLNSAKWIVFDNDRLPQSPFFFCEDCFYTFNYDKEKRKIGQFRAYPYLDHSALA
jgi:hypothetical protein